jgi:hypothetical protein
MQLHPEELLKPKPVDATPFWFDGGWTQIRQYELKECKKEKQQRSERKNIEKDWKRNVFLSVFLLRYSKG